MAKGLGLTRVLCNPSTANDDILVVENGRLTRSDGPLRLIESHEHLICRSLFQHRWRGVVPMANFHGDPYRLMQILNGDEVHSPSTQGSRVEMLLATHHDSLVGSIDLDHVKRGSRGNPQALALAHGEIMNAAVLADHFPARCYQLSRSIRQTFATVSQVGIDEPLVIAARNKTYLLRIGLLGQRQAVLAGKLAHLRLRQIAQGEKRSAKLLLRESEEEIGLILAAICGTL